MTERSFWRTIAVLVSLLVASVLAVILAGCSADSEPEITTEVVYLFTDRGGTDQCEVRYFKTGETDAEPFKVERVPCDDPDGDGHIPGP